MSNENRMGHNDTPAQDVQNTQGSSASAAPTRYGALKCYFYTPKRGDLWGAFCFLFNGTTGEAMDNVFWATRELAGAPIDVKEGWRVLNKNIPKMGVYEKTIGERLSSLVLELFPKSERMSVFSEDNASERVANVAANMRNAFERATHYFLEFTLELEPLTENDLAAAGVLDREEQEAAANQIPESVEKSFTGTLITCVPVIDPVWGIPVSELKHGDKIEVRLQPGAGAGELIQKYLESHDQDAVFPVENIEKGNDDKTYVFLDISDEISGLITVTKDLRLKTISTSPRLAKTIKINMDNTIFLGVIAAAVVAMFFIFQHFFF